MISFVVSSLGMYVLLVTSKHNVLSIKHNWNKVQLRISATDYGIINLNYCTSLFNGLIWTVLNSDSVALYATWPRLYSKQFAVNFAIFITIAHLVGCKQVAVIVPTDWLTDSVTLLEISLKSFDRFKKETHISVHVWSLYYRMSQRYINWNNQVYCQQNLITHVPANWNRNYKVFLS